jgi:hypothetical protein
VPSPELGAGPIPGISGLRSWLIPGVPSPEFGAGPALTGSSAAATVPHKMLPQIKSNIAMLTIFFIFFPPFFTFTILSLILYKGHYGITVPKNETPGHLQKNLKKEKFAGFYF